MREGWPVCSIDEVCTVVNGGTPKTKVADFWGGQHAWITPAEMGGRSSPYATETMRYLTNAGLAKCSASLLPRQSVILSSRAPIGYLVINEAPMAFNQGCKGLIPNDRLHVKYLYYFLWSHNKQLNDLGTGATFKELSATRLKAVQIPVPPVDVQQRIVGILDQAFEGINQAIANTEKNLTHAKELIASSVKSAFEKVPETEYEILGAVAENLDSKRVPITKSKRILGDIPYYGASGVVDHVAEYIFDEDLLLISEDGANLLARTYPIAFSISGKSWVNNHAHVLRIENILSQHYIEFYLNSISLAPWVSGMAQPKLNQKALNSIPVPFPSLEKQEQVVSRLRDVQHSVEALSSVCIEKLANLRELKHAILSKAFSGELTGADAEQVKKEAVA